MLSHLQQYILEECHTRGGNISRRLLDSNYETNYSRAKEANYKKIITQSIERLISRGFIIGYGRKTQEKLFIDRLRLTPSGRRIIEVARKAKQPHLPLNKNASSKN